MATKMYNITLISILLFSSTLYGQEITAIKARQLVDPQSGTTLKNQIILIEDGKIKELGDNIEIPDSANLIDLSNVTVLPGLFDCHTHMALSTLQYFHHNYYFSTLFFPDSFRALQGAANARAMLESGFTTIRDVGNSGNYVVTELRKAINIGMLPGPTIINAGRIIAPYGGQFFLQPDRRDLGEPEYFFADTRDEMKKAIRENIHYGALVIKIVVDDQKYIYSADDIKFIIEEAGKAGLKVAAHCWTDAGARNAAEAGVASIEHGTEMSEETLTLAKKNNVVLVGTDFTEEAANAFEWPELHESMIERLKRAKKVGIKMAFGTDMIIEMEGTNRGKLSISMIDSYSETGFSPVEILKMMTVNAAELLGVDKEKGLIKPGFVADIVATRDNPLENIDTLKDVVFVMKGGKVYKDQ